MLNSVIYNKISSKLENLEEYLKILKEIQKVNKKSFVNDYHFFGLAERYLQLSIESILDVGKIIITSEESKRPENNQEIFAILYDKKIISEKLTEKIQGIVGFRNILVHDYDKIDRSIVYDKLQKNLDDFVDFQKEISKFLKKG